jgi:hypothetical protein
MPTSIQIGSYTFTVLVTDNGSPSLSDSKTFTITVGKRPTTLVYAGTSAGQYSDSVMLTRHACRQRRRDDARVIHRQQDC